MKKSEKYATTRHIFRYNKYRPNAGVPTKLTNTKGVIQMKKKQSIVALLLVFLLLFTACGAKEEAMATPGYNPQVPTETPAETPAMEEAVEEEVALDSVVNTSSQSKEDGMTVEEVQTYAEKIIYTGHVYMETTAFDEAVAALDHAVAQYGGFVQDSSVSGNAQYNDDGSTVICDRWAYYTVRIPTDKFSDFMALTEGIGNVINSSRNAQNVTSQYTDYEARLESLYTQEERLLAMLEESGDLESLITLEARLSEVRYEIESIERNLRNLDQKLAFSTVNLELREVEIYTPTATVQRTFGEKLSDAFADGWKGFVRGVQRFILWFAEALPGLVLWAVIIGGGVLTFFGVKKRIVRKKKKAAAEAEENKES